MQTHTRHHTNHGICIPANVTYHCMHYRDIHIIHIVLSWYCVILALWYCCLVVFWQCGIVVLWYHVIVLSWQCGIVFQCFMTEHSGGVSTSGVTEQSALLCVCQVTVRSVGGQQSIQWGDAKRKWACATARSRSGTSATISFISSW